MILLLIIFFYKNKWTQSPKRYIGLLLMQRIIIILALMIINLPFTLSQQTNFTYTIKHGGSKVGLLQVNISSVNNQNIIKLKSEVSTRCIVMIYVKAEEECVFENGILIYSNQYRNVNGLDKINKKLYRCANFYCITAREKSDTLQYYFIRYNLMSMYNKEPVNIGEVYSDNYEKFMPVIKIAMHKYKVDLPDGSYQLYSYKDGICRHIEIHHRLYKLIMEII